MLLRPGAYILVSEPNPYSPLVNTVPFVAVRVPNAPKNGLLRLTPKKVLPDPIVVMPGANCRISVANHRVIQVCTVAHQDVDVSAASSSSP